MKNLRNLFIKHKVFIFAVFLAGVIIDSSYYQFIHDFLFFPLLVIWIGIIFFLKIEGKITLILCLFLLLLMLGFYIADFGAGQIDRLTTWIYFLIIINLFQQAKEYMNKK